MNPSLAKLSIGFLFVGLLAAASLVRATDKVIDVTQAGVVADGKTLNTASLQKALDDCASGGGGVVHFPAGRYLSGSLVMKSHTTLQLDAGATILGSGKGDDYPLVKARWEGVEAECHRALLWADHAEDIAVTGSGSIEGNPSVGKLRSPRGAPVIEFFECGNMRVEGVTLKSTRMWTLHPTYCHDVRIIGVTFETSSANSDGIDPDSCQHVLIDRCTFTTGDDNIAIKSGKGQEGAKIGRPCEDITITNCLFKKGYTSIAFGSELSGGIRHVRISNCTFQQTVVAALQFKSRHGRGGYVEDVVAEHLVSGPAPLLNITDSYSHNVDPQGISGKEGITQFSHIRISDVKIDAKKLMIITGSEERPVTDIEISRVKGECKRASTIQNVKDIVLSDVSVAGISGPPYFTDHVTGKGLESAAPFHKGNSKSQ